MPRTVTKLRRRGGTDTLAQVITAVVFCPPVPLLIPGLSPGGSAGSEGLADAARQAVAALADMPRIAIVSLADTETQRGQVLPPGSTVTDAGLARSDVPTVAPVTLPGGATAPIERGAFAVGSAVGAHLVSAAGIRGPVWAWQLPGVQDRAERRAVAPPEEPPAAIPAGPLALLAMADGAAAHGEDAPAAEDEHAASFDGQLRAALGSGDPAELAAACRRLAPQADRLRAETLPVFAAVAALCAGNGPARASVDHYGHPYGVGYIVARWRWDAQ